MEREPERAGSCDLYVRFVTLDQLLSIIRRMVESFIEASVIIALSREDRESLCGTYLVTE